MTADPRHIRNFSIIAHIDHGKSTLADRILEATGALSAREMEAQVLDDMDIERERGITIKARAVSLLYQGEDGVEYLFNLIDTPGHVDFSYEVSRSLAACEGALLVVDAAQGVEAQTLANCNLALENDLAIVPVLNKIDLPSARPQVIREQIEQVMGIEAHDAVETSAKSGIGVAALMERIVRDIPPPAGDPEAPLKALLFDSWYDPYRGVMALIRVFEGVIRTGMKIRFMSTGEIYEVEQIGIFTPKPRAVSELGVGEVGFLAANVKDIAHTKVGDTITGAERPTPEPFPGFREAKPMVFAGLFPINPADYSQLREAMEKLRLNDSSFSFEPETSVALGFGFRCGFLGLLHMEIIQQRLEREFDLDLINTAPGVKYVVATSAGEVIEVENPSLLPVVGDIASIEEPFICATLLAPAEYVGGILKLCEERRGTQKGLEYISADRVMITYDFPLNEVVLDFYDRLKSVSRGYASFDYQFIGYRDSDLVKLDVLVNEEIVDALSLIVHRDKAYHKGKLLVEKMRELIPRQLFDVILQAAIGSRVISRQTVRAMRKDVIAKCYGGDITRKRKLLEKQKEGKKRMKRVGRVDIPQEAFLAVLKVD